MVLELAASDWTEAGGGGGDAAREPDRNRKQTALVQRGLGAPKLGRRVRALARLGYVTHQAFIRMRLHVQYPHNRNDTTTTFFGHHGLNRA
jgi:hypothetical protein